MEKEALLLRIMELEEALLNLKQENERLADWQWRVATQLAFLTDTISGDYNAHADVNVCNRCGMMVSRDIEPEDDVKCAICSL